MAGIRKLHKKRRFDSSNVRGNRADNIARARELLNVPPPVKEADEEKPAADGSQVLPCPCPRCGGRLIIIETFAEGTQPTSWPAPTPIRIDTS